MMKRKTGMKRRALLSGLCAMSVGLILWAATLGAMALTPRMAESADNPGGTAYAPTGLISSSRDGQGQNLPRLVPAQPDWRHNYR